MNNQIETIISDFARSNKISKAKLHAFAEQIQQVSVPVKTHKPSGRPVLDKTKALHQSILSAIYNGRQGMRDAVTVRKVVQLDHPELDAAGYQNALQALIKQGKITRIGKAHTGCKGRQPFILQVK